MEGLNGKALAAYKGRLILQPEQRHLLIGSLLGDGCLRFPGRSHHANLTVEHGEEQKEYVWYKYERLREWVLTPPRNVVRTYHKDRTRSLGSWRFSTITHPVFTDYHTLFYRDGAKVVPSNLCDLVEDPLTLAIWLMDDGSKNKDVLFLSTQNFTSQEQQQLCECLRRRFGIDATVNFHSHGKTRKLYRIRLTRAGSLQAARLVAPYVVASLSYKFSAIPL
jgi:hypothetical protein